MLPVHYLPPSFMLIGLRGPILQAPEQVAFSHLIYLHYFFRAKKFMKPNLTLEWRQTAFILHYPCIEYHNKDKNGRFIILW